MVDSSNDVAVEAPDQGHDTVITSQNWVLADNIEDMVLSYSLDIGLRIGLYGGGNALANRLTGGGLADTLAGDAGTDTMVGGAGNDHDVVDDIGDRVIETGGFDTADRVIATVDFALSGNIEELELRGNATGFGNTLNSLIIRTIVVAGSSTFSGLQGNDTLIGSTDTDWM